MKNFISFFFWISLLLPFYLIHAQNSQESSPKEVHAEFKMTTLQSVEEFDAHALFKELEPFWDSDTVRIRIIFQPDPEEATRLSLSGDKNYISLTVTEHRDQIADEVMVAKNGILNLIKNLKK